MISSHQHLWNLVASELFSFSPSSAKQSPATWKRAKRTCVFQCYFTAHCFQSSENMSTFNDSDSFSFLAAGWCGLAAWPKCLRVNWHGGDPLSSSCTLQHPWNGVSVGAPSICSTARGDRACSTAGPSGLWQELGLVQDVGHQMTRNLIGVTGIATDQITLVSLW